MLAYSDGLAWMMQGFSILETGIIKTVEFESLL